MAQPSRPVPSLRPELRHRSGRRAVLGVRLLSTLLWLTALGLAAPGQPAAQVRAEDILNAVVGVRADIPPNARTADSLGLLREGSGIVIGEDGLILTIGYVILEAGLVEITGPDGRPVAADIVGYDHETGFGLVRAAHPLDLKPVALGDSAALKPRDEVLVVSQGDPPAVHPALVVSRRDFAGYWEYLLPDAIFTSPPHGAFGGAALIGRDGRLLGIGSLLVGDSRGDGSALPGNMFVPIDALKPILPELLKTGRSTHPPRPWLGLFAEELQGHIVVTGVSAGGPAAGAGIRPGDMIVSVAGAPIDGLADFYRKVWALGDPGVEVPLRVLRADGATAEVTVRSGDRYAWLRLEPTY